MSSPDPFQEMVELLKQTLTAASASPPAVASGISTSSTVATPMAEPAPYSGAAEECNGFLLQCSLSFELQPLLFPTEKSKIAFNITHLRGQALRWAETIWAQGYSVIPSLRTTLPGCVWKTSL